MRVNLPLLSDIFCARCRVSVPIRRKLTRGHLGASWRHSRQIGWGLNLALFELLPHWSPSIGAWRHLGARPVWRVALTLVFDAACARAIPTRSISSTVGASS